MHECSSQHENIYCNVHLKKDDFILKFKKKKRLDTVVCIVVWTLGRMAGPRADVGYTPFLWYRGFYDTAAFILSVPVHCSATRRFFYLYIHKHTGTFIGTSGHSVQLS